MLDLDTLGWTSYPVPAASRPAEIRAATFSPAHRKVYLVDRTAGVTRLRLWTPLSGFITLNKLPAAWDAFPRMWLSTGTNGDLLLSASKNSGGTGDQYVLMRFSINGGGAVSGATIVRSTQPRLASAQPKLYGRGVNVVETTTGGGKLVSYPIAQFSSSLSPYGLLAPRRLEWICGADLSRRPGLPAGGL
jgi:hypothetical protein